MTAPRGDRPVAVVTGGGGGIGAAAAMELGRRGVHVVTVDPLVSVDGTEGVPPTGPGTADRIVEAGGSAVASHVSVTDRAAVHDLFDGIVSANGRIDAIVNVAGITRQTGFATGTAADWSAVLGVHLDGYLNVLDAAIPIMQAHGGGRILGVTSGSGWRAADAGAYSCAKRAVAALTWQLGGCTPPGVSVNAISPIALTRMVTAALARARKRGAGDAERRGGTGRDGHSSGSGGGSGGLSLTAMPSPEDLAPLIAHLLDPETTERHGDVIFAGGSEVAVIDPPKLIEVVRAGVGTPIDHVIETVGAALAASESSQVTTGGTNPRFAGCFDATPVQRERSQTMRAVAVVGDRPDLAAALRGRLEEIGVRSLHLEPPSIEHGFEAARRALGSAAATLGGMDAVVVACATSHPARVGTGWMGLLAEHDGLSSWILDDARWARAVAEHSAETGRRMRLVTLTDATSAGGRSRAQAAAQLSRAADGATGGKVAAFAVEVGDGADLATTSAVASSLLVSSAATGLAGAELVVGAGWFGLRRHPAPAGSIVFGGPDLPVWFDDAVDEILGRQPGGGRR